MAFKLAKVVGNSHATHGSGLALINCIVVDHSQLCYIIIMHHEGSSPGPGRAWGGAFMAFKLPKVLGNSQATHGSGLTLINCIVADHSQL